MSRQVDILIRAMIVVLLVGGCAAEEQSTRHSKKEPYIVVYKNRGLKVKSKGAFVQSTVAGLQSKYQIKPEKVFSATIPGGVYEMNKKQARNMANDPNVAFVEKDRIIELNAEQRDAPWGLDRTDQADLPLDGVYEYERQNQAGNVNAYIIDTGILTTHNQFEGRALHGTDTVDGDSEATDCNGHGTHVAGTIGGVTYGIAKNVRLHGVRVLDCQGSGRYSNVIAGIEWVTKNHKDPAVANMSLGGPASKAVDRAIRESIEAGVTYVVAAGNSDKDACESSPARVARALTVGSTTENDKRSSFSNFGDCVDIFAPGSDIISSWYTSDQAARTLSGTSMASPHVAGAAALYLSEEPHASPQQVRQALDEGAVTGRLSGLRDNTPNRLLNTEFLLEDGGGQPPEEDDMLQVGESVKDISGERHDERHYKIDVAQHSRSVSVRLAGGSGDADLYVRSGKKPTPFSYDCRPFRYGNHEQCVVQVGDAETLYVMVRGFFSFSGVRLSTQARSSLFSSK